MIDIDKLVAGPELDALIAEKVMGARVVKRRQGTFDLVIPGDVNSVDWVEKEGAWSGSPRYSTDIAAAMKIPERLMRMGFIVRHPRNKLPHGVSYEDWWRASFDTAEASFQAEATTAALAICRAALKAVGVTHPDAPAS